MGQTIEYMKKNSAFIKVLSGHLMGKS